MSVKVRSLARRWGHDRGRLGAVLQAEYGVAPGQAAVPTKDRGCSAEAGSPKRPRRPRMRRRFSSDCIKQPANRRQSRQRRPCLHVRLRSRPSANCDADRTDQPMQHRQLPLPRSARQRGDRHRVDDHSRQRADDREPHEASADRQRAGDESEEQDRIGRRFEPPMDLPEPCREVAAAGERVADPRA